MNVELSICIPTLNRAAFIGETLDSIVAQLEPGVEIVIVDGGSDGTSSVVEGYARQYPAIRYERSSPGNGPSNAGFDRDCAYSVDLARGRYCWLMTDDDIVRPGAVTRILAAIRAGHELIVLSCQVRDLQLQNTLVESRPGFQGDRVFGPGDWDSFFSSVAIHLTFVGAVVVRRSLWQSRLPEQYFGTGFVHVGVLFQQPIDGTALVIAEPLIVIRNGNGQWNTRAFDIFMLRWPALLWSFEGISDAAKQSVTPREPWRLLRVLLLQRAFGRYSPIEYGIVRDGMGPAWRRAMARFISTLPVGLLYWPARLYGRFKHADPRYFIDTLDDANRAASGRRRSGAS